MTTTTNNAPSATTEITDAVRMLQVFTTPQKCNAGSELLAVTTRAAEGKTIATGDRMRCIIIPELAVEGIPSKFQSLVLDALRRTARHQMNAKWKADPMLREVEAAIWSVDSLLLYAARESESLRLTKANCEEWFNNSKLCAHLMQLGDAKKLATWKARISGMAAPTLSINADQCIITIAALGKFDEDATSPIAMQMITRLGRRIEELQNQDSEVEAV